MSSEAQPKPTLKHILTGNKSVREYKERIARGTIFGSQTNDMLPGAEMSMQEAITRHFDTVEAHLSRLGSEYSLPEQYGEGKFDRIQDEAARLMWIYGIPAGVMGDEQRALLLLGAATVSIDITEKQKALRNDPQATEQKKQLTKERKRVQYAVRMIAQKNDGTHSTKIDDWVEKHTEKAKRTSLPLAVRKKIADKAYTEAQYTRPSADATILLTPDNDQQTLVVTNKAFSSSRKEREEARKQKNAALSAQIGTETPHIKRVMRRLGVKTAPALEWIATNLDTTAFGERFSAAAMAIGETIILPSDVSSYTSRRDQQHEFVHALRRPSDTVYLARGLQGEADTEQATDVPTSYPKQRLVSYYVDDVLNHAAHRPPGDTTNFDRRLQGAIQRKAANTNNDYEKQWHKELVATFGLEGMLTYYMIHPNTLSADEQVVNQLLTTDEGAHRLMLNNAHKDKTTALPESFYEGAVSEVTTLEAILTTWNTSLGRNVWQLLEDNPSDVARTLTCDQAVALSQRMDALLFADPANVDLQLVKQRGATLSKIVWLLRDLPIASDGTYEYPRAGNTSENYIAKKYLVLHTQDTPVLHRQDIKWLHPEKDMASGAPLDLRVIARDKSGSINLVEFSHQYITALPGENPSAVYKAFLHTLSEALAEERFLYPTQVMFGSTEATRLAIDDTLAMPIQHKAFAEGVLFAYHQFMTEEHGDIDRTMQRIQAEIAEPLKQAPRDVVLRHANPTSVFLAVTEGQYNFDATRQREYVLFIDDIYEMIEASRLALGCDNGMPINRYGSFTEIPFIRSDYSDQKKVIVKRKYAPYEIDFSETDEGIIKQNLLLCIYGYVAKQIDIYDTVVQNLAYRYSTEPKNGAEISVRSSFRSSAHYGMEMFYSEYQAMSNIITGNQEFSPDLLLGVMTYTQKKLFDLSAIPGIETTLETVTEAMRGDLGDESVERFKRVIKASCQLNPEDTRRY